MLRGVGFGWSGVEDEGGYEWRAEVPAFQRGVAWREREERGRRRWKEGTRREGKEKEGDRARKRRTISGIQSKLGTGGRPGKGGLERRLPRRRLRPRLLLQPLSLSPSLCPSLRDRSTTDTRFDVTRWLATGTWRTVAVERAACPVHLFFQAET